MLFESVLILVIALFLDQVFAEPKRFHPLVGFGYLAHCIEGLFNRRQAAVFVKVMGLFSLLLAVVPLTLIIAYIYVYLSSNSLMAWSFEVLIVFLAIGGKSLVLHARDVQTALLIDDIPRSREKLSLIVSRDTASLDKQNIIKATVESLIENSNDAIYGVLFWYLVAGVPGVIVYRLVNTLDAMWGYTNERFIYFGWAAARLDDVLNYIPARLSVLLFALVASINHLHQRFGVGKFIAVFKNAFKQGRQCASPNAGPVMAAGATAIDVQLGGEAYYQSTLISKPLLGTDKKVSEQSIQSAIQLIHQSTVIALLLLAVLAYLSLYLGS